MLMTYAAGLNWLDSCNYGGCAGNMIHATLPMQQYTIKQKKTRPGAGLAHDDNSSCTCGECAGSMIHATLPMQNYTIKQKKTDPGTGIAHDGNEAVQQHHGHGEDKQQQQDDPNDGVVAVVEEVQVGPSQHDGKEGHKGMQDVAELLQHHNE